ncbi:MAG: hypothetical protein FJ011_23035 [Chloroflexi bacterium]|nr:hypothetical protein [Chloroflexota bacterium]
MTFAFLRRGRAAWPGVAITLLALGSLLAAAGCQGTAGQINVMAAADLSKATQLTIAEQVSPGQTNYAPRLTITNEPTIRQLVNLLDRGLSLGPNARCQGQFRLRFSLATGGMQEFEYFCESGASFLRGDQAFWQGQQVTPPAQFDDVIRGLLAAAPPK